MSQLNLPPYPLFTGLTAKTAGLDEVQSPSAEWASMADHWNLVYDLLQGTLHMRAMGEKWLPREPLEELKNYQIRLQRAVLFEGYKDTVTRLTAKPFTREVTTKGDLSDDFQVMLKNIDRQGADITAFSKRLMWDGLNYGKTHFLVDFPKTGGVQTLADERYGSKRPYFTHVSAPNVIGWHSEVNEYTGVRELTQVRILETAYRPSGAFSSEEVQRVRVLERGSYAIWEKTPKDKVFSKVEEGEMFNARGRLPYIPLVTCYLNRTDYMMATPPLEGLAWMNLAHWQSSADHRNYLRFARLGILFAKGFNQEEIEKGIKIAVNSLTTSNDPSAELKYVEHEGRAFDAGVKDLSMLEERMEVLGLQPLMEGQTTATGKILDEGKADTQAQAWIRSLENSLREGFSIAHEWVGDELDDDFSVDIFNEFKITLQAKDDIDRLIQMRTATPPLISHETFINEVRRRSLLSDDVNFEDEQERISEELMSLVGTQPGVEPEEDDDDDADSE